MGSARSPERQPALKAVGYVLNDWQVSGIWTGPAVNVTAGNTNVTFRVHGGLQLSERRRQPEHHRLARLRRARHRHRRSGRRLQQRSAPAVQHQRVPGAAVGSVGLESGTNYLRGCFVSVMDLAIARNIRLGGARTIQLRVDMFNAFNQSGITGRNTRDHVRQPDRHDDPELAVQPGRLGDRRALAAARRGTWRGDRLPEPADGAGADPIFILTERRSGDWEIRRSGDFSPGLLILLISC